MFCAIRRCSSRAISFVCLIPAEFTAISGDFNPFFDFAINIQLQNSTMIGGQPQRIYWRQKIKIESQRRWSTNDAFVTANCSKKFATNPDINRLPSERILCLPSCYLIIQPIHPAGAFTSVPVVFLLKSIESVPQHFCISNLFSHRESRSPYVAYT